MTKQLRTYGGPPFGIALVHGGPGAAGKMAPVARELAKSHGVLEPMQTADSVEGQILELHEVLDQQASFPVTLAGYSWGAWLSCLYAARFPGKAGKLILISSGPFTEEYAEQITDTRRSRLGVDGMREFNALLASHSSGVEPPDIHDRIARLFSQSDLFDPLPPAPGGEHDVTFDPHIFQRVWPEAAELRKSGALISYARHITCPVAAIHGEYDPHPADGVRLPLSDTVPDFRFILLEKCGHTPWVEKQAKEKFYDALKRELQLIGPLPLP